MVLPPLGQVSSLDLFWHDWKRGTQAQALLNLQGRGGNPVGSRVPEFCEWQSASRMWKS